MIDFAALNANTSGGINFRTILLELVVSEEIIILTNLGLFVSIAKNRGKPKTNVTSFMGIHRA